MTTTLAKSEAFIPCFERAQNTRETKYTLDLFKVYGIG